MHIRLAIGARGSSHSCSWVRFVSFHLCGGRGLRERESHSVFFRKIVRATRSIEQFCLAFARSLLCFVAAAAVMEFTPKKTVLLVLCFVLSCLLLLPRASSAAPLSRSISLRNRQQPSDPAVEVPAQQADQQGGAAGAGNLVGEVAARMDIEVNDYPGSGANNRHEPRSPGAGRP